MNWSFSAGRSFAGCPRRWFYRQVVAHHAAKDPVRREAYLLGKLDSLWSWRGRLVDDVITRHVVPPLSWGQVPSLETLLSVARKRYDAQLAFALSHRLHEPGLKPSQHKDFLLLREVEQGTPPTEDKLAKAWADIEAALTQLLEFKPLLGRLLNARLFPQRALSYRLVLPGGEPVTVRAVPDLIAFFRNAPPLIVDWKVHARAGAGFKEQLAGYAFALFRSGGQPGMPSLGGLKVEDVALLEVQLLTDELRDYSLTAEDISGLETDLKVSAAAMQTLLAGRSKDDRNPYTVPPTTDLKVCAYCDFKPLCWDGAAGPKRENAELF